MAGTTIQLFRMEKKVNKQQHYRNVRFKYFYLFHLHIFLMFKDTRVFSSTQLIVFKVNNPTNSSGGYHFFSLWYFMLLSSLKPFGKGVLIRFNSLSYKKPRGHENR